jgi:hypothetical protein
MALHWKDIAAIVGGQSAFLLIVGAIVNWAFARKLEKFRASLQQVATEHQVRFSKLHDRRAKTISKMYRLLQETHWTVQNYLVSGTRDLNEESSARTKVVELYRYVEAHKLYFPKAACTLLDDFVSKLRHAVAYVGVYWTRGPEYPKPEMREE